MNRYLTLILLFYRVVVTAQSTYDSADFITAGEGHLVSKTSANLGSFDFTQTGANYTWNYNTLSPSTQETISWTDPNNSGYKSTWCLTNGYVLNCNSNFNEAFNLATQELEGFEINGYGLTNLASHYQKTATALENKMLGASIVIGNAVLPITINYTLPDIEYQFPIQFNDNYTTNSQFQMDLNSLGVPIQYDSASQRTNLVEGWGALTTPFGTFSDVLKMKTTIVATETITSASGTNATTVTTITYKWFDTAYGIPILEVSGQLISGTWIPVNATYIDSPQCLAPNALFAYLPLLADYDPITQTATVSFVNTSTNHDNSLWDFGDGNTSTDTDPTHTYTCPGTKQVSLTVTNLFCDPDLTDSITLPIVISDSQDAFTNNVTVTATSLTADRILSGTAYQWVDCNNGNAPIPEATNQTFTPTTDGNYAVILTTNGCMATSDCIAFNVLDVDSFSDSKCTIYPNPTNGPLFTSGLEEPVQEVAVYDLTGKEVAQDLNLAPLKTGIYCVRITTAHFSHIYKVMKK